MQLLKILLLIISALAFLSGLAVFLGARKGEKLRGLEFFIATIGASLWGASIAIFMTLAPENEHLASYIILGIYISPLLMDLGLIMFTGWKFKLGKVLTVLYVLLATAMAVAIIMKPDLLYSSYTISAKDGNSVALNFDFYMLYVGLLSFSTTATPVLTLYQAIKSRSKNIRIGNIFFFVNMAVGGVFCGIFDVLLPMQRYDLIWVGPLAIGSTVIILYYAILRYRMMILGTRWLKILSYIIMIATASIIYMVIFFIIFTALFKIPNPSTSIFVLNFIMIVIVMLLMPVTNELTAYINSLISTGQIDLAYIVKKLNKMATNVDLNELADFLADHLHFSYVGFLINGRLYGSGPLALSTGEIREVSKLKVPEKGIWQEFNEPVSEAFHRLDINAVAQLNNAKGKPFGQILVGKPQGKMTFEHRDLVQLEMIVNLVAALIDTKA